MTLAQPVHLAFLGCGHIGTALLQALIPSISHSQSPIFKITVSLNRPESQAHLHNQFCSNNTTSPITFLLRQNTTAVQHADAVLFAFPPSQLPTVLKSPHIKEALHHKPIISILARTPLTTIHSLIHDPQNSVPNPKLQIVRAMPTISAGVHESATIIADPPEGHPTTEQATNLATQIFATVGKVFRIPDASFDTTTGVSAFSNALVTVAVREIARAAIAEGVSPEHAVAVSAQCIRGVGTLLREGLTPEELRHSLSAPGSITGLAVKGLVDGRFEALLEPVLAAAVKRAREYST
ncbi:pyrroline-5-carboxylate reductase family protein [Aspergillus candidus]|uniref:Putative pyrroline-5-carboxylate reductase n=1 Tax=Aspergillus candidus TaxID=41067 RepID=A0A2I2FPU1_ASPCN|nr:putative pyrroline-5-carboxylate reductase [Aspergillus candidus]PLB42663.1 putative pyrroline-5-carboxylate reductase [Aspergillus candidus]